MNDNALPTPAPSAGLLESTVQKLFMRPARVSAIETIGSAFRLVTLTGDALRNVSWTPGDKVQIQMGGWTQRTYTPIAWDANNGTTRLLLNLHTDGPGGAWARTVSAGDACMVFGPRSSLNLARLQSPIILFGDDTSLGLAAALAHQAPPPDVHILLEVAALADTQQAVARLALPGAILVERAAIDAHAHALASRMGALLQAHPTADVVLTGRAASIQAMRRVVKQHGARRCQAKAYWAPGKTGLD